MTDDYPFKCVECGRFVGVNGQVDVVWPNGSQPDERVEALCKYHKTKSSVSDTGESKQ